MDEEKKEVNNKKESLKTQKVVKNPVKIKKKGKLAQIASSFFVDDLKSVLSWGVREVIIPAMQRLFVDFVDSTANSMVYGRGNGVTKRGSAVRNVGGVSYMDYYDRKRTERIREYDGRHEEVYSFGTVEVETREEARDVLNHMAAAIDRYGYVTVGHFMEMLNVQPKSTDFNWGWTSIEGARIIRVHSGGYEISLPKVMQIE